jgi:Holliday junction resolvasome RuvABC ATP-dependent DNA helicase subunit
MERQDYFEGLIAQDDIKDTLTGHIDIYKKVGFLPHLFISAPRGCGKTVFARKVGKGLKKKFVEINAGSIGGVKQFFHNIIVPHVQDQDVTIFLDEAHKLPKDVENCLLTILQQDSDTKRSEFEFEDYVYDFDFKRLSVIAATTEPQGVFHALMDRFEQLELDEYSPDHLGEIVQMLCKDVVFWPPVLEDISTVLRGNARAAAQMADKINNWMSTHKPKEFVCGIIEWEAIKSWLKIKPLGLGKKELQILRLLGDRKEVRVTAIAATLMLTRQAVMREEQYLQKQYLMEIKSSVRCITKKGQEYLDKLEEIEAEIEAVIEPVKPVEPVPAPAPKPKKKPVTIKLPAPAAEIVVPTIPEDFFELIRNRER